LKEDLEILERDNQGGIVVS